MDLLQGMVVLTASGDIFHDIYQSMHNLMGSDLILAGIIFLFFFVFTLILGLGMLIGSVVLIPSMFLVFEFVPDLKIFIALFLGLFVGLALHKFINR